MSRLLTQASKLAPSLSSGAQQSFSTTTPVQKKKRHDDQPNMKPGSPIALPNYRKPGQISSYEAFVSDLRRVNKLKEVTQAEAQRALRQYFVNFFGKEAFEDIRTQRQALSDSKIDKDKKAWSRLLEEGQQYWRRR